MEALKMILAGIYILSPIDILPEAVLGPFGLLDDGAAVIYLVSLFFNRSERKQFEKTEKMRLQERKVKEKELQKEREFELKMAQIQASSSNKNSENIETIYLENEKSKIGNKIIALIILIGIGVAGTYYFMTTKKSSNPIVETPKVTQSEKLNLETKNDSISESEYKKYDGVERDQIIMLNGKKVYIDEYGYIIE